MAGQSTSSNVAQMKLGVQAFDAAIEKMSTTRKTVDLNVANLPRAWDDPEAGKMFMNAMGSYLSNYDRVVAEVVAMRESLVSTIKLYEQRQANNQNTVAQFTNTSSSYVSDVLSGN